MSLSHVLRSTGVVPFPVSPVCTDNLYAYHRDQDSSLLTLSHWTGKPLGCLFLPALSKRKANREKEKKPSLAAAECSEKLGGRVYFGCACAYQVQADLGLEASPWLGRAGWSPRVSISAAEAVRGNQGLIHQSSCREGCSPKAVVLYMLQICYLKFCVHTFILLDVLAQPDRKDLFFMVCNSILFPNKESKWYNTFWSALEKTLPWHEIFIHPFEISVSYLGSKWELKDKCLCVVGCLSFLVPSFVPPFYSFMCKAQNHYLIRVHLDFCSWVFSFTCSYTPNKSSSTQDKSVLIPNISDEFSDSVSYFPSDECNFS